MAEHVANVQRLLSSPEAHHGDLQLAPFYTMLAQDLLLHYLHRAALQMTPHMLKKKGNHYIFSSQLRADQMPGPPREGQLMCTPFLSMRQ